MEDIFRKDDGSTLTEGRKKIYSTEVPMKLILPDGKDDGTLEKGDLVYVVQKIKKNGNENYRFMVMKFADTDKQKKLYFGDSNFFKRYYEETSKIEGEDNTKNNKVPLVTGLAGGIVGYIMAKNFQKNQILFSISGIVLGVLAGNLINKMKK